MKWCPFFCVQLIDVEKQIFQSSELFITCINQVKVVYIFTGHICEFY